MKHTIIFIFSFFCIVLAEEKHSFRLEDGSKVIGYIISEDEDIYELDTKFGLIQIEKKDIKKFECIYFLNDGNVLVGNKISSSDSEVILNTDIGVFKINKDDYFLWLPKFNNEVYIAMMFLIAILK